MSDYLNTIPPSMPEMLPYFKLSIVGWDYCEQLERILNYYKERTQKEIINKHIKNRWEQDIHNANADKLKDGVNNVNQIKRKT